MRRTCIVLISPKRHCLGDVQRQLVCKPLRRILLTALPAVGDLTEIDLPRMSQRQRILYAKAWDGPECYLMLVHEHPARGGMPHSRQRQQDVPRVVRQAFQQGRKQFMHGVPDGGRRDFGQKHAPIGPDQGTGFLSGLGKNKCQFRVRRRHGRLAGLEDVPQPLAIDEISSCRQRNVGKIVPDEHVDLQAAPSARHGRVASRKPEQR